mmetsp:Transcript_18796/g.63709  ORF Transcript_18796/g.63709 Transcript_18796/m.63709 type:complete len:243 (+) Transcript_18796:1505-2233(+)
MSPLTWRPSTCLACRPLATFLRSVASCFWNSGRSCSRGTRPRLRSFSSVSAGRTMVTQSLDAKHCAIMWRIWLATAAASDVSGWGDRHCSRYCRGVMRRPASSSSESVKSRTTHKKLGNTSCRSAASVRVVLLRSWIICERFATRLRSSMALASITPRELYTKKDESSSAMAKMRESCVVLRSVLPRPSVSMYTTDTPLSSSMMGMLQIHMPLVHAFTVEPMAKPSSWASTSVLSRKLLPVL